MLLELTLPSRDPQAGMNEFTSPDKKSAKQILHDEQNPIGYGVFCAIYAATFAIRLPSESSDHCE
jgi:hypothetical protein